MKSRYEIITDIRDHGEIALSLEEIGKYHSTDLVELSANYQVAYVPIRTKKMREEDVILLSLKHKIISVKKISSREHFFYLLKPFTSILSRVGNDISSLFFRT
jgi:hypothetical protein